ncbi:alpha/beta hydrolase [Nesterenkonia halobia]|uniref:Alpha/beta hydrolase n=1 Tax=Nesterenkonia halobia TaxID=37922 RepID=A0ABP6RGT7_9MICC
MQLHQGTVAVAGATLHYETCGQGPPLLLIQGGISEAGATRQFAGELARRHQVISYDRRGLSRSPASSEVPVSMRRHADDASAVLAELTARPAVVIGASIGALIGLHLAVDHPGQVDTLIAHEPPMTAVVADAEREAGLDAVAELARSDVFAAIGHMASLAGPQPTPQDGARPEEPVGDVREHLTWFFAHDFPAVRSAALDADAVRTVPETTRIVPTGGADNPHRWERRCAAELATALDRDLVELSGGHNGFVSHPWATAAEVTRLLREDRRSTSADAE